MSLPNIQVGSDNSPMYVHRANVLYLVLRLILALLVTFPFIALLIALIVQAFQEKTWDITTILIVVILFPVFAILWYGLVFPIARNVGKKVEVYPNKLIIKRWNKQTVIPLEHIAQIYTKWRTKSENLMIKTKVMKLRLVLHDGSEHSLNWGISNLEQLEAFLQQGLTDRFLPQALQAVQQGQTVSLGDNLQINHQGVTTNKGTLAWAMVQRAYFNKNHLLIAQKGQAGAWDSINVNKTPNRMIIEALINSFAR